MCACAHARARACVCVCVCVRMWVCVQGVQVGSCCQSHLWQVEEGQQTQWQVGEGQQTQRQVVGGSATEWRSQVFGCASAEH